MTDDKPIGRVDTTAPSTSPLAGYGDALVDSTTELVDSTSLLAGGQSTPIGPASTGIITNKNRTNLNTVKKGAGVIKSPERMTVKPAIKSPGVGPDAGPGVKAVGYSNRGIIRIYK